MAAENQHKPNDYRHRDRVEIKRALLSVSDKTGLLELAKALSEAGVAIVSTGSTAKTIADAGYAVTEVSEVTGFPESLDGRVKTLHPKIHGGLLADLRLQSHEDQLVELGIESFQLVVVNLYPFMQTVASGAKGEQVVEQIDIGGPAMVRACPHRSLRFCRCRLVRQRAFRTVEAAGRSDQRKREQKPWLPSKNRSRR